MKKLIACICALTCVLGLTACGEAETLTEYEQSKIAYAETIATEYVIPSVNQVVTDTTGSYDVLDEYTADEVAYTVYQTFTFNADGYAFLSAIESFENTIDEIGEIQSVGECETTIDDDQIVVNVSVQCADKEANAEIIFTNDMFFTLQSASLSAVDTFGESMQKAAMNTLMGMGTVFLVLILISGIIWLLSFVPKIQAKLSAPKSEEPKPTAQTQAISNAVSQIEAQEASAADDLELAAVIAAAVAAYQGNASASGFVVRSIKRRY